MSFNSLQSRILVLFLTLVLGVQFVGFLSIRSSISKNARASVLEQLDVGSRVFQNLLQQHAHTLIQGAGILAADYGFRQSITTNDHDTIVSALNNHRNRIGADIALLYDAEGQLQAVASDLDPGMIEPKVAALVASAQAQGHSEGLTLFNNHPHQVVVVPIKAPLTIGWIAMGFAIDNTFTTELKALSRLEVSFLVKSKGGEWVSSASTYEPAEVAELLAQSKLIGRQPQKTVEMSIGGDNYSSLFMPLNVDNDLVAMAVLQRSINEAVAPYNQLQLNLLILTLVGAIIFIAGSIFTARKITRPLTELTEKARMLEQGHYDEPIHIELNDEIGELGRAFESMRNGISARESNVRRLAYWDTLTKLPNRAYFNEEMARIINQSMTSQPIVPCAVMMLDLDRFKHVNDVMGPAFGDQLLQGVAERLRKTCVREQDFVARLDGDEFGILLPGITQEGAVAIAKRLLHSLELPIELNDHKVDISAGIGIACAPQHTSDPQLILSLAETAMFVAKAKNAGALVYDPAFDVSSEQNLSLMSELRNAVEQNELKFYVQPKICLRTLKVIGMEALVRWIHPVRGFMPPDSFIPFAEQTGMVRMISLWMLTQAAKHSAHWQSLGIHATVAVNLSVRDLMDTDLPTKIGDILSSYDIPTELLSVEITESSIMDDPERALQTIERLYAMGIKLAIDDFGTGYSSLSYLKRLPLHEIKIDKSFVMNMAQDKDDAMIVKSTIDLGHDLGLKVVAEGIENENIQNLLKDKGCDFAQGYHFSKPMPADQFSDWLAGWNNTPRFNA